MVGIASAATHAYRARGVPMFRNQNIRAGALDDRDLLFIDPLFELAFKNKRLKGGDLLTARTGYPGTTCIVPPHYGSAQSFTTLITRPKPSSINATYLCYYINSEQGQRFFNHTEIGGAQKNVNAATLRGMPIALPPLSEQAAISEALSDVDGLIGALDRLIAKKRDLKQAAMQQLLTGRTRLPGFASKSSFVESLVGQIPADWAVARCDQLCSAIQDGTHFSPPIGGGDRLYLTSRNIRFGVLDLDGAVFISEAAHRSIYSRCPVTQGDVLLTKDGANTGNAAIHCLDEEVSLLSSVAFLRFVAGKHDARFYLQYILSHSGQRRLSDLMSGNAITRLTLAKIRAWTMPSPPFEEQIAIADILSDMDADIAAFESRRDKTRLLKQGMMQELLTGRTRLT